MTFWTHLWFWWLLAVALSWVVLEVGSIVAGRYWKQANDATWTLSDTIRRWSAARRWLAPLVVGTCAFLLVHWFGMGN